MITSYSFFFVFVVKFDANFQPVIIEVSIRISESHGSELSEYTFLYARDKIEELPLGNSYQQNEFSATSPSKVQNEPLAQGVDNEETLSSASKEKFSGENITE